MPLDATDMYPAAHGLQSGRSSVHTSRTIMLDDLAVVMDRLPPDSGRVMYQNAIIEENVLGKATRATRIKSAKRLGELYGLDAQLTLFRLLRKHWALDPAGRPMLAMLAASARDPLLRDSTPFVLAVPIGEPLGAEGIAAHLAQLFPHRFSPTTWGALQAVPSASVRVARLGRPPRWLRLPGQLS